MPRIPVRTEPYTSPSRQHRHFKNKRDQVLRALGKAAYINGSHFAIMWVSARGEVETYASDALQGRLDDWFVKRGISDEAKDLVRASRPSSDRPQSAAAKAFPGLDIDDDEDDDDDVDDDDDLDGDRSQSKSTLNTPNLTLNNDENVFIDTERQGQQGHLDSRKSSSSRSLTPGGPSGSRLRRPMAQLDTNIARQHFQRDIANSSSPNNGLGSSLRLPLDNVESNIGMMPHSAPLRGKSSMLNRSYSAGNLPLSTAASSNAGLVETTFQNEAARTAFLELRFGQLQQGMCKTVSKAWIKIIEPKKQTRCPYNRGEEGKPDWWPLGVRHKEPDHLMKPERHALLLTILRSPKVKIARLQLATAEVVALMKADKVSLLMDVYRVAREEENRRIAGGDVDAPLKVAVSTLDGWSEGEQCAIASPERSGSPGIDDDSSMTRSAKKRTAIGTPLSRSSSSSAAFRANKRVASSGVGLGLDLGGPSSNTAVLAEPSSIPRRATTNSGTSTWLLHEPSRYGIKRTSVSNHPHAPQSGPSSSSATIGQPQQLQGIFPAHGLMMPPPPGNAQLMDPAMLAHNGHFGEPSTSQAQHGSAFAHGGTHQHYSPQSMRNQHGQAPQGTGMGDLAAYQSQVGAGGHALAQGNNGTLSIQGMDMSWNMQPGFQGFGAEHSGRNWWDDAGHHGQFSHAMTAPHAPQQANAVMYQQMQHAPRSSMSSSGAPNAAPAVGDGSFDASFASTIESAGPATPPGSAHAHHNVTMSSSLSKAGMFSSGTTRLPRDVPAHGAASSHPAQAINFDAPGWMYSQESSQ